VSIDSLKQHEALVQSLMDERRWPAGGGNRRRIDTHISTVLLAGDVAYKLKKPLDLGFLDFLSLDSRHAACVEELRLNRRLAPEIYQAVCAITGSVEAPDIDGVGPVIDWAVRMQRFDPDAILSDLTGRLSPRLIERLALQIADFHARAEISPTSEPFGAAAAVFAPMQQNFVQIRASLPAEMAGLERIAAWSMDQRDRLAGLLDERKVGGHIRECHGDLHLGNVALIAGEPVVFDAIEFNPGLRWIDTINDVAFLSMDLHHRRPPLAYCLLDHYLQASGDYSGLQLLRFYEVYRALVRTKIAAIRATQELTRVQRHEVEDEFNAYLGLADRLTQKAQGAVVITYGVSGSGKSHAVRQLPEHLPAVRLRSDVERKRLLGLDAHVDATTKGAYSSELTQRTYARLEEFAAYVVQAGMVAIVDATFLRYGHRARLHALADVLQVPFVILDCDAPVEILRERILARRRQADNVSDADLEVLDAQLQAREPLTADERLFAITVGPEQPLSADALTQRVGRDAHLSTSVRSR
jgi:aminoglycoside phosphotransferase family enzyme/predicted kinase